MWKDFKAFVLRGNVIDLGVAVVIGAAFGAVTTGFVKDLLTPLITIPGKVNFESLTFTVRHSTFAYGDFLNLLVSFLIVAAAIFFLVIKPVNMLQARRSRGQGDDVPTTRPCPECLSDIALAAKRCAFCTAPVEPIVDAPAAAGDVAPA
jgi:large conductance mechanosensitive channel